MSDNLRIWEKVAAVPSKAQKKIMGGRLKGFTDINPMWRLKVLTELFGPVGEGWYTEIASCSTDAGADGLIVATVIVKLYYKIGDNWSNPVYGIGGSMLVAKEKSGPNTSDEAFKMAETDAISVACKKLGIGADVYWEKGRSDSKYSGDDQTSGQSKEEPQSNVLDADEARKVVDNVVKLGDEVTSVKALGDLWKDNIKQINKLPMGLLADLTSWKDERKAELTAP